jgi:GT2 family glycosyltransferase
MLNNDTQVTSGWLQTLINHLRSDKSIGMIGPVTNNIGNEACIKIRYQNAAKMHHKSRKYSLDHMGELLPIRTLAFFCVMLPRSVYEIVGPLDEAFGRGFFEDDDYCRRIDKAGLRLVCAEDVFIHHELSASFNKLGKERQALLEKNRKIYEAKWGPWIPHRRR